ncbi:MAG: hypothetical protein ACUVWX_10390 [Kiritimatiellia bacterium]
MLNRKRSATHGEGSGVGAGEGAGDDGELSVGIGTSQGVGSRDSAVEGEVIGAGGVVLAEGVEIMLSATEDC